VASGLLDTTGMRPIDAMRCDAMRARRVRARDDRRALGPGAGLVVRFPPGISPYVTRPARPHSVRRSCACARAAERPEGARTFWP
jgi:hypothetical protein